MCVASKGRRDHYHREAPQPIDGDIARIQMDFMFVGAEGTFVDEPRARATVLMVICKDDGNLSATEARSKTDENGVEMVIRFLSTYESVEIKTDGEPSIVEVARRVQARRDKTTTLAQTSVGGHQEIGAVEHANGTVQAQLRAYFLDVQNRMHVRIIPGTQLFPWMLRHSVWTVVRYQSDQRTKQTPYERTRGCRYESALVPFGEVVMAKIADADKMRAGNLDSAWVKAVWVGRVDRSNEHLLLTTKGCIRSRVVRRIPDGNQASYHAEVQGLRQTATETDVIEQNIVMDSGTARTSENIVMGSETARASDGRADQGVMRMDQEEGISEEEQARRRLRSKQSAQQTLTDDETVSKRLKREATIATIKQEVLKTVAERRELEHAHEFYSSIRTLRSPESIQASRMVEINKWRERGVVERWSRQAAIATGEKCSMHAGWIMAEGMRLHAHSRGQASVALSSCEAEVMAASEGIKMALLLQEVLMFVGLGHYEIEIKVDSSAAHAFFHRRGVGRMKHIDSRILWLQDLIAAGGVRLKKIPRTQNLADMLTHTPSAKELEMFLPLMSLTRCSGRDKELMATRRYKPVPVENLKVYSHD